MNEPKIESLKAISFIPNYYIDMKRGRVYSLFRRGRSRLEELKEVSQRSNGKGTKMFSPYIDGKQRGFQVAKVIAAIKYNVEYDKLPDNVIYHFNEKDGLSLHSLSELMVKAWEKKKQERYSKRIALVDVTIEELRMLRESYEGNVKRLLEYVYGRRDEYIGKMLYFCRKGLATEAVDEAIERLCVEINEGGSQIWTVSGWILRTARCLVLQKKAMAKRQLMLNVERM